VSLEPVAALEALLFATPEPLPPERLAELLPTLSGEEISAALASLKARYASPASGLMLDEVAGGFRLGTRPEAAEAIAIIAYRQPITKAEVEAIRGVNIDGVLRTLGERGLIRILGRKREAGRPMLYGTSRAFLEYFGFQDLSELPTLREIEALVAPSQASRPAEHAPREEPETAAPAADAAAGPAAAVRAGSASDPVPEGSG